MSFDAAELSLEVLEEFASIGSGKYGGITYAERNGYRVRESALTAAARRALPENRARAIEVARAWRAAQYADPVKAEAYRKKCRAWEAAYRSRKKGDPDFKKRITAKQRRAQLRVNARRKAVREAIRLARGTKYLRNGRELVLAIVGDVTAALVMAACSASQDGARKLIERMVREGLLVRIRPGVYRRSK